MKMSLVIPTHAYRYQAGSFSHAIVLRSDVMFSTQLSAMPRGAWRIAPVNRASSSMFVTTGLLAVVGSARAIADLPDETLERWVDIARSNDDLSVFNTELVPAAAREHLRLTLVSPRDLSEDE